jgi:DNA invertase Pin-like site-specific DNA recombinase
MKKVRSEINLTLTVRELELFQRALLQAADDGMLDRIKAINRIGELQVLSWEARARGESKLLSAKISKGTKEGLTRQRLKGTPGPGGRLGPGRPEAEFDEEKARRLRATVPPHPYSKIAQLCGVSKATIIRFFGAAKKAEKKGRSEEAASS